MGVVAMTNVLHFTLLSLSLLVCCWFSQPIETLAGQDDSAGREEAIRLLQSAATQSALGQNVRAEERCRELLDSPKLLKHVDPVQVRLVLASSLKNQKRHQEAYDLLVETLQNNARSWAIIMPILKTHYRRLGD